MELTVKQFVDQLLNARVCFNKKGRKIHGYPKSVVFYIQEVDEQGMLALNTQRPDERDDDDESGDFIAWIDPESLDFVPTKYDSNGVPTHLKPKKK